MDVGSAALHWWIIRFSSSVIFDDLLRQAAVTWSQMFILRTSLSAHYRFPRYGTNRRSFGGMVEVARMSRLRWGNLMATTIVIEVGIKRSRSIYLQAFYYDHRYRSHRGHLNSIHAVWLLFRCKFDIGASFLGVVMPLFRLCARPRRYYIWFILKRAHYLGLY